MTTSPPLIARLALDLTAGEEIQLLPDGEFRARDGRPGKGKRWRLDAESAARIIALADARQTRMVIDYEHQTLRAGANGAPAPAAGWFKRLVYRPGEGLFATDVQWTERARTMIAAGEYRYLSPVFRYDPRGAVLELAMASLTNVPALDQLDEVQLKAAASLCLAHSPEQELDDMPEILQKLISALGLPETTSEQDALAACAALKTKAEQTDALQGEVAVLKTKIMDPAKYVPVEVVNELKGQLVQLSTRVNEREVEDLIDGAIAMGKLATPAEQQYARTVGKSDVAALKQYIEAAPAIAALKHQQTRGKPPAGDMKPGELSESELAVCRTLNLDPEEFKKTKAAA